MSTETREPAAAVEGPWAYDHSPFRVMRNLSGESAAQAGAPMGVSAMTYQRYEDGEQAPRIDDLVKFCNAKGVSPFVFLVQRKESTGR